jgi:DNA-binding Xre family transcriptional regulator
MESTIIDTKRGAKSAVLTEDELMRFQHWVNKHLTKTEAAKVLGFSNNLLGRLYYTGRGAPVSVEKIRAVMNKTITD